MIILESKQVGNISYMFDDIDILDVIVSSELIKSSQRKEKNPHTGKLERFVSFSRNLTSAAFRNNSRWKYGIIVDGTKLSDRYSINPVSYVGSISNTSGLKIKYIAAYNNNTYVANFVNWSTTPISKEVYNRLKEYIESLPEDVKQLKKLTYTGEGTRVVKGRKLKEKYLFNVPTGSPKLSYNNFPELYTLLTKDNSFNETEERVWCGDKLYISVRDCIIGIIMPKSIDAKTKNTINDICDFYNIDNILTY